MATVFSPEAVAAGHIPQEGAHNFAAQQLMSYAGELAAQGAQVHLLVYGSVGSGRPAVRSDMDVVAVIDTYLDDGVAEEVATTLADISRATHVPIDARVVTMRELHRDPGLLGDELFVEHLTDAQATSAYQSGDVSGRLREAGMVGIGELHQALRAQTAAERILPYLVEKAERFSRALGEEDYRVKDIQRALELPASLGRKMGRLLQLTGELDGGLENLLVRRDAERVPLQLLDLTRDNGWTAARALNQLNADYERMLRAVTNRRMSVRDYDRWLRDRSEEIFTAALRLTMAARRLLDSGYVRDAPDAEC